MVGGPGCYRLVPPGTDARGADGRGVGAALGTSATAVTTDGDSSRPQVGHHRLK